MPRVFQVGVTLPAEQVGQAVQSPMYGPQKQVLIVADDFETALARAAKVCAEVPGLSAGKVSSFGEQGAVEAVFDLTK